MAKDAPKQPSSPDRTGIVSGAGGRRPPRNRPTNTSGGSFLRATPRRTGPRSTPDRASIVSPASRSNANRVAPRRRANQPNRRSVSFEDRDLTRFVAISPGPPVNTGSRSRHGFTAIPPRSTAYSPTSPPGHGPNGAPDSPQYSPTSPPFGTPRPPNWTSPTSPPFRPRSPNGRSPTSPRFGDSRSPTSPIYMPHSPRGPAYLGNSPVYSPVMPRSPVNKDSPNLPPTSPVEDRANSPHTPPPNESPINRRIHRTSPRWDAYGNIIDEDSEEEIDDNIPEEGPTGDIPEEEPNEGNDPCPKVRRERDNALAEIDRLQTRIRHTLWDNNNATDELNERHQRTVELLNRGKMEAHWEIDRLGGVIPEPPSHQGSPQGLNARRPQAPRDDSLEDYVEEEVDPCDEVRRERDDAVAERDRLTAERNNLTLQSVLLQAEIDRLEGIDVLLERHEQTITRLHLERDAARLRPDGEEIGDDDRMNIHRRLAMERHATRDLRRNAEIAATTIHNLQGAMNDLRGAMHDLQGTNRDLRNERNATHREYERSAARLRRRVNAAHREIIRLGGETPETPDRLSVSPEIPQMLKATTTTMTTLAASSAEKETMLSERMQDFTTAWVSLGLISFAYIGSSMKLVVVGLRLRGNLLRNLRPRLLTDRIDTDQRLEDREEGVGFMVHYHRILPLLRLPPLRLRPLRILPLRLRLLSNKPLKQRPSHLVSQRRRSLRRREKVARNERFDLI